MKKICVFIAVCVSLFVHAQTQYLSSSDVLHPVYQNKVTVDSYHSQMSESVTYAENSCYTISSGSSKIAIGQVSYTKRSEYNSALVLWNTKTGTIRAISELGDATNNITVRENFLLPSGKIFIFSQLYITESGSLMLGNQNFSYRTDTLPSYMSAQFNIATKQWEQVHFYYVGRKNNDNYISEVKHVLSATGDIYMCGSYSAPYIIIDSDTIVKRVATSHPFFVCKLNASFQKQWVKQAVSIGGNNYVSNVMYGLDAQNNMYIGGTLGYVTGAVSVDGVIVKNDTILDEYDYTYTDLFLYKIDAQGTVQLGKTFLFRGTEQLADMKVLSDGSLYMVGDYSGEFKAMPYGDFPGASATLYYNTFIMRVNGSNGSIIWGQPIVADVYYQERFRTIRVDADENVYVASRFRNPQVVFMGNTYYKRTDNAYATQILFAKINKDGVKQWANVLGATTSFPEVIQHQSIGYWSIQDTTMILSIPYMNYGTNKNVEWGDALVPTVSVQGTMFDNVLLLSANTGNVYKFFNRGYESLIQIDSISYFGVRNEFEYFEVHKITSKTNSIQGSVYVNGAPYTNSIYTYLELISVMPGETGTIKQWATLNQSGEFSFDNVPYGGEYIISIAPNDSTIMCGYYSKLGYALWNQADTVRSEEQNDNLILTLQKITYPTGTAIIRGTLVIEALPNQSIASIDNVQVILRTQQKSTNIVAFTRAYYDYFGMTQTYTYEFKNIPKGEYEIEVLYPFATSSETISVSITQDNQVIEDQDFRIVNNTVLKRFGSFVENITNKEVEHIVYSPQHQTIQVANVLSNASVKVYSIQGSIVAQGVGNCTISLAHVAQGVYIVQVGNTSCKIVK